MMNKILVPIIAVMMFASIPSAFAHTMLSAYENNTSEETALEIPDFRTASYFSLEEADKFDLRWYKIIGDKDDLVENIQVLVPKIDGVSLNYEINIVSEDRVFREQFESQEPVEFHEPFSNTDWWIVQDIDYVLPQGGIFYIVVTNEDVVDNKYAFAIGSEESFEIDDYVFFPVTVLTMKYFFEDWLFFISVIAGILATGFLIWLLRTDRV